MTAATRKIPWRTVPLRLVAGVVGLFITLFVTYLVVINALFVTGVAKIAVNQIAPAHAHFEWRTAYSTWFLRVHTTDFVVRGEDSCVEWRITADRANASFGALDFLSRRVRLHDVWALGLSTRIRFKLDPVEATPDYVAKLPPIAGFEDPPLKPAVLPPPLTDENYNLWTVEIDDAVAEAVREVWVDTVRVVDVGAHVEGGFYLKPMRRLFVRPSEVRIEDGSVFDGKDTITSELHGTFELHIAQLDLVNTGVTELIHAVDAKAKARTKVGDLRFLDPMLLSSHVALAGGGGPAQVAIELQRGELVSGSRASMRAEGLSVWSGHDGVSATALLNAVVPENKSYVSIAAEAYGLGIHRDSTSVAYAPAVSTLVKLDNLDLGMPFDAWAVSINAPSVTAKDLKALNGYFDTPFLYAGSGTLSAYANITPKTASGHAKIDVSNAVMEASKTLVTLSGTGEVMVHGFDRASGKGDLAGARLNLRDVAGGKQHGWWANLSANPLSIAVEHGVAVSGMVTGECRDAQLPLVILDAPGIVRDAFGDQSFTGASEFRLSHRATDLSDLRFIGNSIEVHAHYHGREGAAIVDTPFVNVGVVIQNGETSTHLLATHEWYARTLAKPRADRR